MNAPVITGTMLDGAGLEAAMAAAASTMEGTTFVAKYSHKERYSIRKPKRDLQIRELADTYGEVLIAAIGSHLTPIK